MPLNIPLPEPDTPDIFSYGFDEFLYRDSETSRNPLFYDSINDAINPGLIGSGTVYNPVTFDSLQINSLLGGSLLEIQDWQFDGTFSASDTNTVAWTSGTITLADGTTFSISSGNTGDMTELNYIYFSKSDSETVLQKSTTASDAVGANKILIAVAKDNAGSEAVFQVFGGSGGIFITADNIAADSITANEIAANTITAGEIFAGTITATEMTIAQLSAISADLGTITAGTVTGVTIQTATSGARIVMNNSDFRVYDSSALRIHLSPTGDGTNPELRFYDSDASDYFSIKGTTSGGNHYMDFLETWGSGDREVRFEMAITPKDTETHSLGKDGYTWNGVYTSKISRDGVDYIELLSGDLNIKTGNLNILADSPSKYLKIDTDQGTVGISGANMFNGPYITTDYHSIRFEVSVGGDQTGHVVASKGASLSSEIGTLMTGDHKWIVMVHDGDNGRLGSDSYSGGSNGGAIVLDPANGLVVLENSDELRMFQEDGKYFNIDPSNNFLNFTSEGFSGNHGFSFGRDIWLGTGINILRTSTTSNIGHGSYPFANIYSVNFHGALFALDITFDNDWVCTEHDRVGIKEEGIAIIDKDKNIKLFIGKNGLYTDNKIKELKHLK